MNPTAPLRLVSYARVSTAEQLNGDGLGVQADAVAELAAAEGAVIVAAYRDEGISGGDGLDQRLGLAEALALIHEGEADAIAVYRLDRLARDLILQETLLRLIWDDDGQVLSCDPTERQYLVPDDVADPTRTLVRRILGAVAQYERSVIRLRLVSGRRRAIAHGKRGGGPVPYGWQQAVDGLEPEPNEMAVVSLARQLAEGGAPLVAVAQELNDRGLAPRRGATWNHRSVRRMLDSWEREVARHA